MIDFSRNHFELFGLPERFRFDPAMLDSAYHALQGEVHPDRHAAASATEQRIALQSSARVNEAYRALKDPVARAQYLLSLHGVDAFDETNTALPFAFLERQLERRESAETAMADGDAQCARNACWPTCAPRRGNSSAACASLLDVDGAWAAARGAVRELRFLAKLAADVDAMLAAQDN